MKSLRGLRVSSESGFPVGIHRHPCTSITRLKRIPTQAQVCPAVVRILRRAVTVPCIGSVVLIKRKWGEAYNGDIPGKFGQSNKPQKESVNAQFSIPIGWELRIGN